MVGLEPNGYKVCSIENDKFVLVSDVIVDKVTYLKSRPVTKEVYSEASRKTNASGVLSKSVEMQVKISRKQKCSTLCGRSRY